MKLLNSRITIVICSKDYVDPFVVLKKTNLLKLLEFVPIVLCFYQDSIKNFKHKNLKIIKGKKNGIYSSFNSAIKLVETSHYIIIGDDDKFIGSFEDFNFINSAVQLNTIIYLPVKKGKKVYSYFKKQNWYKLMIGHFPSHSGGIIIPKKAHEIAGFYETENFRLLSDILFIRRMLKTNKFLEIYIEKVFFDIGLTGASSNFRKSLSELYNLRKNLDTTTKFYNLKNYLFLTLKFIAFSLLSKIFKPIYRLFIYYNNSFSSFSLLLGNEKPISFYNNKKFRIFLPGPSVTNFELNSKQDDYVNIYVNNSFSLLEKFKTKNNFYFTSDIKRAEEFIKNNTNSDIKSILYPLDFFQLNRKIIHDFDHVILPNLSFFFKYGLRTKSRNVNNIKSLSHMSNRYRYGFGSLNSCLALIFDSVSDLEIWGADFAKSKGAHFDGHSGFVDNVSPFKRMKGEFFEIIMKLDCNIKINGETHDK
jgi:hypothetical protein